ncbi:DUF1003 domain-containing protein [Chryseobacterium carnipullorum]|uniref:Uncharacterized protein n=1 Tax=Chryseobacterium carnipullorum TaxID=1124835 RepID=A0A376E5Z1_CHRCU|nr:DUF1003 domain-containing protein [Chryseobacterium carnipullorum]STD03320.1 Uncharacterised protein [Chryseobacterium carnipullorum]
MKKETEKKEVLEKIANGITWWVGSIPSLIVHTLFFITSFLLPMLNLVEFDKMLLILTTVVSLEAIYLAIFIQMSVNKAMRKLKISRKILRKLVKILKIFRKILKRSVKTLRRSAKILKRSMKILKISRRI